MRVTGTGKYSILKNNLADAVACLQRPASGANSIQRRKSEVGSDRLSFSFLFCYFLHYVVYFKDGQRVSMWVIHKNHL
jgi:hypothetical protein